MAHEKSIQVSPSTQTYDAVKGRGERLDDMESTVRGDWREDQRHGGSTKTD